MTNHVYQAESYRFGEMGSFGKASGMLLRQSKFPDTYTDDELVWSSDHDRVIDWDYEHWKKCVEQARDSMKNGGLENWFQNGKVSDILAFLIDALKANEEGTDYADIKWTGFRVLGSVNRSNGYPVYSLQLFAKKRGSKTKVYSNSNAPNVKGHISSHNMVMMNNMGGDDTMIYIMHPFDDEEL